MNNLFAFLWDMLHGVLHTIFTECHVYLNVIDSWVFSKIRSAYLTKSSVLFQFHLWHLHLWDDFKLPACFFTACTVYLLVQVECIYCKHFSMLISTLLTYRLGTILTYGLRFVDMLLLIRVRLLFIRLRPMARIEVRIPLSRRKPSG